MLCMQPACLNPLSPADGGFHGETSLPRGSFFLMTLFLPSTSGMASFSIYMYREAYSCRMIVLNTAPLPGNPAPRLLDLMVVLMRRCALEVFLCCIFSTPISFLAAGKLDSCGFLTRRVCSDDHCLLNPRVPSTFVPLAISDDINVTSMCIPDLPRTKVDAVPWFMVTSCRVSVISIRISPLRHVFGEPQLGEWVLKSPATISLRGLCSILRFRSISRSEYSSRVVEGEK